MDIFERILSKAGPNRPGEENKKIKRLTKHILIRYNDQLKRKTIFEHEECVRKNGFVWFGKIGRPISKTYLDYVQKTEPKPFIFFYKTTKQQSELFYSQLIEVSLDDIRETKEKKYIPSYYRDSDLEFGVWFKVGKFTELKTKWLQHMIVHTSRAPIIHGLASSAGAFFVEIERDSPDLATYRV